LTEAGVVAIVSAISAAENPRTSNMINAAR